MSLSLSPAAKQSLRDFFISVSLANLLLLRRWYDVEDLQRIPLDYFRTHPPSGIPLIATLIAMGILSAAILLLAGVARRSGKQWLLTLARVAFLAAFIVPLESVRQFWNYQKGQADWTTNAALFALELLLAAGIFEVFRGRFRILLAAERVAGCMAAMLPIFLIYFAGMHAATQHEAAYHTRPALPLLPPRPAVAQNGIKRPAPRVIWLLFDEFDQRLAFDNRQPGVELPELDRLRSESFVGMHVLQTAGFTMLAVPSLISSRIFSHAEAADASTLLVQPSGSGSMVSWRDQPNVFRRARDQGANAALVGWHHPYCRVLGDSLARCFDQVGVNSSDALATETYFVDRGLARSVIAVFEWRWKSFLGLFSRSGETDHDLNRFIQSDQQQQYFQIRDHAYQEAVDPRIDFLYVHFPTPHLFAIYDAQRKDFTLSEKTTYFDNLALVDRTVGELRKKLEQAGMWDTTTLLISADHGLRYVLWHGGMNWTPQFDRLLENGQSPTVPFIVKLGGENKPAVYDPPFSAVVTGDLALAVLRGDVTTSAQAAAWIAGKAAPQRITERLHAGGETSP
jgi:hypothetical protein